ncbi:unnamed protein product, partial [Staurois parvus]
MKNACKAFSRYSDGQNTEHRMDKTLTKFVTHCNDQFTPQTFPTLGNKRYVNDHSHLKFLM